MSAAEQLTNIFNEQLTESQRADRQRQRAKRRLLLLEEVPKGSAVALIGCGKTKSDKPERACELYTSSLFEKTFALAGLIASCTFIVSAEMGLLDPDTIVEPYEAHLGKRSRAERRVWGHDILAAVTRQSQHLARPTHLVLFMGSTYAEPLFEVAEHYPQFELVDALEGLQIGDRLAFLNLAIRRHEEDIWSYGP